MKKYYLGIDVGTVSVSVALLDNDRRWVRESYEKHGGEPDRILKDVLGGYPLKEVCTYALTGVGAARLGLKAPILDPVVVQIEALKRFVPKVRNILYIGGGSFSLTYLDGEGRFLRNTTNSACASGTGAFLDQQALRLGLEPEEIGRIAASYKGLAPTVATRCAVFAKTDMIHLQQEGFPIEAVAKGLCEGLGASTVDGLLGGRKLTGKTAVVGGVAKNACVVEAVRKQLGVETVVPPHPECGGACGAAFWASVNGKRLQLETDMIGKETPGEAETDLRPPLSLELSKYPEARYEDFRVDEDGTEVALLVRPERERSFRVALGIDIGSTSTKATLAKQDGSTVAWAYRKTAGAPLEATQFLFKAFRALEEKHGIEFHITGAGTTGSGRKMVGRVIGADLVLNEITAHARAALEIEPEVDTIIELGGQDAKFTQLSNGVVYNSVMNYVCAAGTGSFIEEQARKLGIPINEFADLATGVTAPVTSDRCTVYMERDLDLLLASGWSKAQVAAAVLHSVRDNYLNKVVGSLHIGNKVVFQGATARNRGLVAAFEQRLKRRIMVSELCHMTGALGMSLLVNERCKGESSFRGLDFADQKFSIENEICNLCSNRCRISLIRLPEEVVAWGLKCGREYEDSAPKRRAAPHYRVIKRREAAFSGVSKKRDEAAGRKTFKGIFKKKRRTRSLRVGIPRSLSMHSYLPLWRRFFQELGCEVVLSKPTSSETLARGEGLVTAEFCAPVLAGLGHVDQLLSEDLDFIFLPHTISEVCPPGYTNSYFCCYLQGYPSVSKACGGRKADEMIVSPCVDFGDKRSVSDELYRKLRRRLGAGRREVAEALSKGCDELERFRQAALLLGREALKRISGENSFGIVLLGRPYNTLDRGLNLDLPRRIAEMGYTVLYQDMLGVPAERAAAGYPNMYWHYGQIILSVADYVASQPALFPVYFTNFACGPDSYILSYFKQILSKAKKPYLVLQLDAHGADAGYLTRIEAAVESFESWSADRKRRVPEVKERSGLERQEVVPQRAESA